MASLPLPVRVVLLPSLLTPEDVRGRVVVAFDVLRATTTMAAALAAGVPEIVLHPTLDAARDARRLDPRDCLLAGESQCLKPHDFDLGNSPGDLNTSHAGKVLHMATTNGTKALLAANAFPNAAPHAVLAGAIVNRLAVARACVALASDPAAGGITLLCAGTEGEVAYEDVLGCGAVMDALMNLQALGPANDAGLMAIGTWTFAVAGIVRAKPDQPAYPLGFRLAKGAVNVSNAGLAVDVAFAARPDVLDTVPRLFQGSLLRPWTPGH